MTSTPKIRSDRRQIIRKVAPVVLLVVSILCFGSFSTAAQEVRKANLDKVGPKAFPSSQDYRIGPDDLLNIIVWKSETFSKTVRVRPDGKITLPLINDIQASGQTPAKLRSVIEERLSAFLEGPRVSVIVQEINSAKFTVLGEVKKPGVYPMRGETSILDAIAMAEGLGEFASPDQITILRKLDNVNIRLNVRYRDLVRGSLDPREYLLMAGDTIVVP